VERTAVSFIAEEDIEEQTAAPPTVAAPDSGKKKRKPESADNKSKNCRNTKRVAIGSMLKDVFELMKTPSATCSSSDDPVHQELRELRQMNQRMMESNASLMLQLSVYLMREPRYNPHANVEEENEVEK
jgi:hypothetical protein